MQVHVKAHGVLRPHVPQGTLELAPSSLVNDLLAALGLGAGGVWMILVNGSCVDRTAPLHEGDRIELVPPLGGG